MCSNGVKFLSVAVVSVDLDNNHSQCNAMQYQGPRYHIRRNIDLKRSDVCGLSSVNE